MSSNLASKKIFLCLLHEGVISVLEFPHDGLAEEIPHREGELGPPIRENVHLVSELKTVLHDAPYVKVLFCRDQFHRHVPRGRRLAELVFGHSQAQSGFDLPLKLLTDFLILIVILVDTYQVCNLHNSFFRPLKTVPTARRDYKHHKINDIIDLYL